MSSPAPGMFCTTMLGLPGRCLRCGAPSCGCRYSNPPAGSGADEHHDGSASEEVLGRGWSNSDQKQCRRQDDLYTAPNCETRRASLIVRCGACRIISHGLLACE